MTMAVCVTTDIKTPEDPTKLSQALDAKMRPEVLSRMTQSAQRASDVLKAISHEGRLMILCHLVTGEKSVTELEQLLSVRQAAVSQQLSHLRLEGMVVPRRQGKTIFYRLTDDKPRQILEVLHKLFCETNEVSPLLR